MINVRICSFISFIPGIHNHHREDDGPDRAPSTLITGQVFTVRCRAGQIQCAVSGYGEWQAHRREPKSSPMNERQT